MCVDVNNNNRTLPDSFCDAATRPDEEARCGNGPCATGWRKGPWTKVDEMINIVNLFMLIIAVLQNMPNWISDA